MTEQAVEVHKLFCGVICCPLTKLPLHFANIHRSSPVPWLPLLRNSPKAWGLRRWTSFSPLCPCGRLSRSLLRGSAFLRPQTTMPRPTLLKDIGIAFWVAPALLPTSLVIPSRVSRVHGIGLKAECFRWRVSSCPFHALWLPNQHIE